MNHADIIHSLDVKYGWKSPDAVTCPNDGNAVKLPQSGVSHREHGNMVVHQSGAYLVCGVCGAKHPTSDVGRG